MTSSTMASYVVAVAIAKHSSPSAATSTASPSRDEARADQLRHLRLVLDHQHPHAVSLFLVWDVAVVDVDHSLHEGKA